MKKPTKSVKLFVLWLVGATIIELIFQYILLRMGYTDSDAWYFALVCLVEFIVRIPMLIWINKCARKENVRWLDFLSKFLAIFMGVVIGLIFIGSVIFALIS